MKIPKKVKVGGVTYKVKEVDEVQQINCRNGFTTVGLWEPIESVIYLDKHLEKQAKERMFLHELFHAIFDHCNIEQAEDKVELLSTALYMVIKDNPELFN